VKVPPGNWFAPPGSNQSSSGSNEAVGAFGVEGRVGDLASVCRNVSERCAGPETGDAEADPPRIEGRPKTMEEYERKSSVGSAGVLATACRQRGSAKHGKPQR